MAPSTKENKKEELIIAIQEHPVLYDKSSCNYNDAELEALCNLEASLCSHYDVLLKKIGQLNADHHVGTDTQQPKLSAPESAMAQSSEDLQKRSRQSAIEETIVRAGSIRFSDVAGLTDAKQALTEAIVMPLHFPQLFTGGRKPWKRILLYGPPGTGKSRLAQAVASEINSTFYSVSSADLVSSWVGESEKLIKELFLQATNEPGRSVVFIDEIDSICRKRNSREEEHTRRIKTELLKQMEGADTSVTADKIFLLCATNCPWELDLAFLRRFQKRIYIPLPDRESRLQLMKLHCRGTQVKFTDDDWNQLADQTDGYSGSDIATFTLGALLEPVRDLQSTKHWTQLPDGHFIPCSPHSDAINASMVDLPPDKIVPRDVSLLDFIKSLQTHRKTVCEEELQKFEHFTKNFGEHG
ncbi:vacuolar protein sorting-associated protein 4B-like [Gigantopelta aegis]|uniref:vacuolar protein sorting-associated protein 4B-like n=1 Tax=Gigantopelta aegis TaxID=1735272 RepID=UPI001B8877F7|nr:vacuolar protein sorting-associated protein 4B-like [Gigantopelta aegis]